MNKSLSTLCYYKLTTQQLKEYREKYGNHNASKIDETFINNFEKIFKNIFKIEEDPEIEEYSYQSFYYMLLFIYMVSYNII